jgi:hypothetical protein
MDVGHVIETAIVDRQFNAGHDGHRVRSTPVRWKIGLSGQVGRGAAESGRQVVDQPPPIEPALAKLQHR